ncbi:DUF6083 domain-containing protein [Kineococcus sp. SYSU DK001]|uniref:DUF6083 domain-containing protein n=1 Tax=Kineococcus sp. SYSU DK001 TaxID=3383122 RepID=UPI003D7CA7D7
MAGQEVCAFCAAGGDEADEADVQVTERLGVRIAVCAGCRERFAARPAVRPAPVVEAADLPPTLGQQTSAVLEHVRRMQRRAAERPYVEEDCAFCGHVVHRYPGPDGAPVRLAKEPVLAAGVPAQERWRVEGGRARPAPQDDPEDEDAVGARVRHEVVCPEHPAPDSPRLLRMWRAHHRPPATDL